MTVKFLGPQDHSELPSALAFSLFHEFIAAEPLLNPKKGLCMTAYAFTQQSLFYRLNAVFLKKFFTKTGISSRFVRIVVTLFSQQSVH